MAQFSVFVPKQAVGADLVYFDLFVPSGSQWRFSLLSCQPVVSGAVAVTGVVGVDLLLTRTSAVGTGGTGATYDGAGTTAMTISGRGGAKVSATDISGRLTPTGGATAAAVLGWGCVFSEETNAGTYVHDTDLAQRYHTGDVGPIQIPEGSGIRVVQGAVASVGNIGFNLILDASPK